MRAAAFALVVVVVGGAARGDFVRGTVKIDVRSPDGAPVEARVTVQPAEGGEVKEVQRVGQVYVADGLVPGSWRIEVAGAAPQTVRVPGRQPLGVVAIVGVGVGGGARGKRGKRTSAPSAQPGDPACDTDGGVVVEAVAFAHGGLAAGRLEVRPKNRAGKLVCVATIAGGGASLRLKPGAYAVDALFVGGGSAHAGYELREDRAPPPLVLRGK